MVRTALLLCVHSYGDNIVFCLTPLWYPFNFRSIPSEDPKSQGSAATHLACLGKIYIYISQENTIPILFFMACTNINYMVAA